MTEKTLGYVELEWTCPNCQTRNPGPQKTCTACGSPQPQTVVFESAQQDQLITDAKEIEAAQKGPDIHCPYCGARNPADAQECHQCGGNLASGTRRASGQVVGAFQTESAPPLQVPCPNCQSLNPATNATCSACGASMKAPTPPRPAAFPTPAVPPARSGNFILWLVIGAALLVVLGCILFMVLSATRRSSLVGRVENVAWKRSIAVEELRPVRHEAWKDQIPSQAVVGSCTKKYRLTQNDPAPVSTEVCGTPYKKDTGSGYARVVQDCEYRVYADSCEYTVKEWQQVNILNLQGEAGDPPRWPELSLSAQQRRGQQTETYQIQFQTDQGQYTYTTDDAKLFARCTPGSRWELSLNLFNSVIDIQPK